jgi:hypothetical protein
MNNRIIYNFLDDKDRYIQKCIPYLKLMNDEGLLKDLLTVLTDKNIDSFRLRWNLSEKDFNDYDIEILSDTKNLLIQLINDINLININDETAILLTKIIAKKYIIMKVENLENTKVLCEIKVDDKRLLVNCYHSVYSDNLVLKPIKGSVDINSEPIDAMIKEINEELGLCITEHNLTKRETNVDKYGNITIRYEMFLTMDEFNTHLSLWNTDNLDPEIRVITLLRAQRELLPHNLLVVPGI